MTKSHSIASTVGIVAGLLLLGGYFFYVNSKGERVVVPSPIDEIRVEQIALAALQDAKPIQEVPPAEPIIKVGEDRTIDFLVDRQDLGGNPAEWDNVLRDWIMLTRSPVRGSSRQTGTRLYRHSTKGMEVSANLAYQTR